jgi:hypothetical protein
LLSTTLKIWNWLGSSRSGHSASIAWTILKRYKYYYSAFLQWYSAHCSTCEYVSHKWVRNPRWFTWEDRLLQKDCTIQVTPAKLSAHRSIAIFASLKRPNQTVRGADWQISSPPHISSCFHSMCDSCFHFQKIPNKLVRKLCSSNNLGAYQSTPLLFELPMRDQNISPRSIRGLARECSHSFSCHNLKSISSWR